jgi:uncharacterized protein
MKKLKRSHYLIVTDSLNDNLDRIIFSTRTSEAFIVEDSVYYNFINDEFMLLSEDILEKFIKFSFLVPEDENELEIIIQENKKQIADDRLMYEVIQPTAMCQLGCDYCGQDHKKVNINSNMYEQLISRYKAKVKLKDYKKLYVGWFGAEPLLGLKQIRELTSILRGFCEENNMRYGAKIVTNGLSLKENIFRELVEELGVDMIEITLDGTAIFHDQRRHTKEKISTFDIIFNNLLSIVNSVYYDKSKVSLSIRCNVDERNYEGVLPLIELLDHHKLQHKISHFYPIGVYSWGNDAHKKSLTKEDFAEMEIDWLIEMIKREFPVGLLPNRVKKVCLAVSPTSEMVDAYGNIYNCTEVSYVAKYEKSRYNLGNVKEDIYDINQNRPLTDWNDIILANKVPCYSCEMLPVCGGACPKSWHEDMRACPPNKFNIKEKLALSYLVSQKSLVEIEELNADVNT